MSVIRLTVSLGQEDRILNCWEHRCGIGSENVMRKPSLLLLLFLAPIASQLAQQNLLPVVGQLGLLAQPGGWGTALVRGGSAVRPVSIVQSP
jgi:hypothetical protein